MSAINNLIARKNFPEMDTLERLIESFGDLARVEVVEHVEHDNYHYPLYTLEMGSKDPTSPVLAFFGGVHGLEKIGSEVILSYMELVLELYKWDHEFQARMQESRLLFMPIVNPLGIILRLRANANGIDLMRNAPIEADVGKISPIFSGHRISPRMPWYRGVEGGPMEKESTAMIKTVEKHLFPAKVSMSVDVHSGFGVRDRFWFPYAHSRKPFPYLPEVVALKKLFDRTYPHHFYEIEPVSRQYLINGDLWDYMVYKHKDGIERGDLKGMFVPFTLEMGSWLWLKKNPRQILSSWGLFHPMKPHRYHRTLRRHITLFDFLHRAVLYPDPWMDTSEAEKQDLKDYALETWYAS